MKKLRKHDIMHEMMRVLAALKKKILIYFHSFTFYASRNLAKGIENKKNTVPNAALDKKNIYWLVKIYIKREMGG